MKANPKAVTVSHWYLDPAQWAVKYLTVAARADGTAVWYAQQVDRKYKLFYTAETRAKYLAAKLGIPYVEDVRHGERITEQQKQQLHKHGFTVESLIKERARQ